MAPAGKTRSAVRADSQWRGTQYFRTDHKPELCWALREVLEYDLNHRPLEPRDDGIRTQRSAHPLGTKRLQSCSQSCSLHPTHGTLRPHTEVIFCKLTQRLKPTKLP